VSPAGLPASYIVRQLNDFKNDLRHSADPRKGNSNTMVMLAKAMTDDEIRTAAAYFAAVTWRPHVQVVETDLVPKTRIQGELFIPTAKELTEPTGNRIIEVPEDWERVELRDPKASFVSYVPKGSVAKGEALVASGGGKTIACAICHGVGLKGLGDVPNIAGRSPGNIARQIYYFQTGDRGGPSAALMKAVVDKLTGDDALAIAAYVASLEP